MSNLVTTYLGLCWIGGAFATLTLTPIDPIRELFLNEKIAVQCSTEDKHKRITWTNPRGVAVTENDLGRKFGDTTVFLSDLTPAAQGNWTCSADGETPVSVKIILRERIKLKNAHDQRKEVREGSDLALKCEVDDSWEPTLTPTIEWWRDNEKEALNITDSRDRRKLTLYLKNIQRNQSGEYICRANVVWRYRMSDQGAEKKVIVTVQHKPIHTASAQMAYGYLDDNETELRCEVAAEPPATFTWFRKSKDRKFRGTWDPINPDRYVNDEQGYYSLLPVKVDDENVFGEYKCVARNEIGTTDALISFQMGNRPEPPLLTTEDCNATCRNLHIEMPTTNETEVDTLPVTGFIVQWRIINKTGDSKICPPNNDTDEEFWLGANETEYEFDEEQIVQCNKSFSCALEGEQRPARCERVTHVGNCMFAESCVLSAYTDTALISCGNYPFCFLEVGKCHYFRVASKNIAGLSTYMVLLEAVSDGLANLPSIAVVAVCSSIFILLEYSM